MQTSKKIDKIKTLHCLYLERFIISTRFMEEDSLHLAKEQTHITMHTLMCTLREFNTRYARPITPSS